MHTIMINIYRTLVAQKLQMGERDHGGLVHLKNVYCRRTLGLMHINDILGSDTERRVVPIIMANGLIS